MVTDTDTCSYPSDSAGHVHAHTGYNVFTFRMCWKKYSQNLKKQFTDACSHIVHKWWYASGSVVHVYVDTHELQMDIQGAMHFKKQFTDACSHKCSHMVHRWWHMEIYKWQCSTCMCRYTSITDGHAGYNVVLYVMDRERKWSDTIATFHIPSRFHQVQICEITHIRQCFPRSLLQMKFCVTIWWHQELIWNDANATVHTSSWCNQVQCF